MFQPVPMLVYLLIWCGQANGDSALYRRIPNLVNYLCPGSNVCPTNRSSESSDDIEFYPGKESCCTECSCSAECTTTRNCCFQNTMPSEGKSEEKAQQDNENDLSCLYPILPQDKANALKHQSFLMVTSVKKTGLRKGQSYVSCGDKNVAPWGSLYPVYSQKSRRIYKNIECAREDGMGSDVIFWDAFIDCKDMVEAATWLDTSSVPENCKMNFILSRDLEILSSFKCYINLTDTCPNSKDFQVPEGTNVSKDEIKALCSNSGIRSPYRGRKLYSNVFCSICNEETFSRADTCDKLSTSAGRNGGSRRFIALIDQKFITERSDDSSRLRGQVLPLACSPSDTNSCREIFCPTGQLRDVTNKCVYPNKMWHNQNIAVFINLTLENPINLAEVFSFEMEKELETVLRCLESAWMKDWSIGIIYYKVMKVPNMANILVIVVVRTLSSMKPDTVKRNIQNLIGQSWTLRTDNGTEVLKSSGFSTHTYLWLHHQENKTDIVNNRTVYFEYPFYKKIIVQSTGKKNMYNSFTKLYFCDQVELNPSEFLVNREKHILYSYTTQRFFFGSQFVLTSSNTNGETRARICVDDSGLHKKSWAKNLGTFLKTFNYWYVASMLLILLHQ